MNTATTEALEEIAATFPDAAVTTAEDANGTWVTIDTVDLGPRWMPNITQLTFHIATTYPYADVYPHFLGADVVRTEGGYADAVTPGHTANGKPVVQVSRRSNNWNPATDTAALKALRVIDWLRDQ